MIKSFLPSATVFTSNGERIIQAIKCIEHRELGDWYVDLVAPLEYQSYLEKDYILVVPTKEKGDQPFRINNPKITDKVDVRAYHIGFDTKNYAVELSTVINGNAQACLDELTTNIDGTHPFTFTSSITTLKSFSVVDTSLYNALIQIADEYNGILDFNGWTVTISSSIGADNGVILAYGKNIQESEINENWDLVVTRLKPIGNNGITLTPAWLTADVSYDRPYTKIMNFDTDDVSNLALVSQLYLDRYKVPRVNYKVKADVEQNVALGDAVTVNARQFTTTAEVLSFDYNPLINRVIQVEFGNFRPTLKQFFSDQAQVIENKVIKKAYVRIDESNSEIELKVNKDGVIGAINLTPELAKIIASKIELEGIVTANTYFKINLDGSMETTAGKIGRFEVSGDDLVYTSDLFDKEYDWGDYSKLQRILAGLDTPTAYESEVYDVNSTGTLTVTDLVIIRLHVQNGDPLPTPRRQIRSVIRIGTTSGELRTTSVSALGNTGSTFVMKAENLSGELLNVKGISAKGGTVELLDVINGVRFPSSFVGSSDAKTLDDYYEGAWTPVLVGVTSAGTGTYSAQVGTFTKIGNVVHFDIYIVWTAHTGTGQMKITLPFTAGTGVEYVCNVFLANLTFSNSLAGVILSGDDDISLFTYASNSARSALNMDTAATLSISGTYRV